MPKYLFSSHDGFGLGHVRRNSLIARALLRTDPDARITIVTGLPFVPRWLRSERVDVVQVPPLIKNQEGGYRAIGVRFEEAVADRAAIFLATVERVEPDVVVVDRHPYGTAGELRPGIERIRARGGATVLGLRDILDEPSVVAAELQGRGWADVDELFDGVLVYGDRRICDHEVEYRLPVTPRYCGWVTETAAAPVASEDRLLVVSAGGGGDGAAVFKLGAELAAHRPDWSVVLVGGPFADRRALHRLVDETAGSERVRMTIEADGCSQLFGRAAAVVQMAGYNSTFEALAAGVRPILVPRQQPRREQSIRAHRLAALGLADVIDADVSPSELGWLIEQPRRLPRGAVERAGIRLDGAETAASILAGLAVPAPQ